MLHARWTSTIRMHASRLLVDVHGAMHMSAGSPPCMANPIQVAAAEHAPRRLHSLQLTEAEGSEGATAVEKSRSNDNRSIKHHISIETPPHRGMCATRVTYATVHAHLPKHGHTVLFAATEPHFSTTPPPSS